MKRRRPLRDAPESMRADSPAERAAEKRYFEAARRGDWKGALSIAMAAPEGDAVWARRREVASKVVAGSILP